MSAGDIVMALTDIRCPPRPLQERFGEVIRDMLGQQDSLMIQDQKLIQARELLLPRLMNGEIAV